MRSQLRLADLADIASGTAFANLTSGLTAGELVNQGSGFSIETVAGRDKLVIANAGTYLVTGSAQWRYRRINLREPPEVCSERE